jgi:hypothetical protein
MTTPKNKNSRVFDPAIQNSQPQLSFAENPSARLLLRRGGGRLLLDRAL